MSVGVSGETLRPQAPDAPAVPPSFAEATSAFLRIGLLSFGGPAGQIALMHKVLVEEKRWLTEARFLHALSFCMLLPGPEAQQLATYTGWLLHGVRGGVVAGTLFILPGFCVILALSTLYALFQGTVLIEGVFFGLKAAVLAIVLEAMIRIGRRALKNRVMIGVAVVAFLSLYLAHIPFPLVVLGAALFGAVGTRLVPGLFTAAGRAGQAMAEEQVPLADRAGTGRAVLLFVVLWALPFLILSVAGRETVFLPLAAFFSKMAVVTFGGAYAVLAYVAQQAVVDFGWLRPGEMLDGLALAETTPGPLILVLTYVGFLAAYRAPGGLDPLLAGVLGAVLTTWVTFVPCFLWIFAGAPFIERLRQNRALSGALAAITAAVVGVIGNLALWFALNVVFRRVESLAMGPVDLAVPVLSSIDPAAALLALAASVALLRFHVPMLGLLGAGALSGLLLRLITAGA